MRRLHCDPLPPVHALATLGGDARRHALVLRLAAGDAVVLFDGHGHEADARIVELGEMLVCRAESVRAAQPTLRRVVLVQCLAKGEKLDEIVRAVTEAGVAEIRLALGVRDVAKWSAKGHKLERLERIAREAARQSGRSTVPELFPPLSFSAVAGLAPSSAIRVALVPGAPESLLATIAREGAERDVWLVVGSEGGLEEPLDGWLRASLGPHVLRVEHAGLVGVAMVMSVP